MTANASKLVELVARTERARLKFSQTRSRKDSERYSRLRAKLNEARSRIHGNPSLASVQNG